MPFLNSCLELHFANTTNRCVWVNVNVCLSSEGVNTTDATTGVPRVCVPAHPGVFERCYGTVSIETGPHSTGWRAICVLQLPAA